MLPLRVETVKRTVGISTRGFARSTLHWWQVALKVEL